MAKVGLDFGEKIEIFGKRYRLLNDGLLSIKDLFGQLTFVRFEGANIQYAEDTTQPRRSDGTYPNVPTGEVFGLDISVYSSVQGALTVTLTDVSEADFLAQGLVFDDAIDLVDTVVTYSNVSSNKFKLFASTAVKSAVQSNTPTEQSKPGEKPGKDQK